MPIQVASADAPRAREIAAHRESPITAPASGPITIRGNAKNTPTSAPSAAPITARRCATGAPRAERARGELDAGGEQREQADPDQRSAADVCRNRRSTRRARGPRARAGCRGSPGSTTPATPSATSNASAIQSRAGSTARASTTLRAMSRAKSAQGWTV
jgi:hypothetical protein